MGVSRHAQRLATPAALALVLMLASSTSPPGGSQAADAGTPGSAPSRSVTLDVAVPQAPASVTQLGTPRVPGATEAQLPPAVHVASTAALGHEVAGPRIAQVLLDAYRNAARSVPASCNLPVSLLAAIGEVESGSLVGRAIDAQHRTYVMGPVLNGNGFAAIPDTDNGRLDGDSRWDRAMGPMQFVPSTWQTFGVDGDGDGVADPQDIEDAAASAAGYLCYGGRDLSQPSMMSAAILSYNHSAAYEQLVLTYQRRYAALGIDDPGTVSSLPVAEISLPAATASALALDQAGRPTGRPATASHPAHPARSQPPAGQGGGDSGGPGSAGSPTSSPAAPTGSPADHPTDPAPGSPSPVKQPTEQPTQPTQPPSEQPTEPPNQQPKPTEPPNQQPKPTEPPAEPPNQQPKPTEPPSDPPSDPPSQQPTEPPAPSDPPTEAPPPSDPPSSDPPSSDPTEPAQVPACPPADPTAPVDPAAPAPPNCTGAPNSQKPSVTSPSASSAPRG